MRRELAGLLVVLCLAGCGGGDEEEASPLDRLVDDVAAGGAGRERAVGKLAKALNGNDRAIEDVDHERTDRALTAVLSELRPLIGDGSPTCGSWADRPRYVDLRAAAEVLLDVAGRSGAGEGPRAALTVRDPYLAAWAVRASVATGAQVDDAVVARVARDDYARSVLFFDRRVTARVPAEQRTLEARARADMTQWLIYPTELGCQPTDLRLMEESDSGDRRYFLFRFRPGAGEPKDSERYQVGVSGPWTPDGELADSGTFSDFEPVGSASPAEHLKRLAGITAKAGR